LNGEVPIAVFGLRLLECYVKDSIKLLYFKCV